MAELLATFRKFVKRERLFTKKDKLLLACSGGVDSTVLAYLLHAEGYQFGIAHMNFQLRGEASMSDAIFVKELAKTLDASFHSETVHARAEAKAGESTQMVARRLRYEYFEKILDEYNYAYLLTAHHLEDSLETFLMQLIRGSNYGGPSAIASSNQWIRRPLLGSSKKAIEQYATDNQLKWREDASNATDDYLRNRVRHHLTPVLFEQFGLSPENWLKTATQLQIDKRLIETGQAALQGRYTNSSDDGELTVRRTSFPQDRALLREVADARGFTPEQVRQMLTLGGGRRLHSPNWSVTISAEAFIFSKKASLGEPPVERIEVTRLPFFQENIDLVLAPRPERLDDNDHLYLAPPTLPLHL
ncbi:MAG: tRNA lysidine(34) synthetase TilS, partial [Bacteroidota bacterium]